MDMMHFLMIYIHIVIAGVFRPEAQNDSWEKQLEKDGITVHTRSLPDSKLKSFRAEMTVSDTDLESVKDVLVDVQGFAEWTSDVKSVKVLQVEQPNHKLYRLWIQVPFPFERRDLVQEMKLVDETDLGFRVVLTNRPGFVPPDKKCVRMPAGDGYWEVSSIGDSIRVVFEYHSDPGGDIPPWLVNMFIVQSPFKTLRNFRDMITE